MYVVKSAFENYATFDVVDSYDCNCPCFFHSGDDDDDPERRRMVWTDKQSKAAFFKTRAAAQALASACFPTAGARVVKVVRK